MIRQPLDLGKLDETPSITGRESRISREEKPARYALRPIEMFSIKERPLDRPALSGKPDSKGNKEPAFGLGKVEVRMRLRGTTTRGLQNQPDKEGARDAPRSENESYLQISRILKSQLQTFSSHEELTTDRVRCLRQGNTQTLHLLPRKLGIWNSSQAPTEIQTPKLA